MRRAFGAAQTRRIVWALAGALVAAVLATRVYVDFDRVAIPVIDRPQPPRTSLAIPLPDSTRLAGAPAAVVLRVTGGAREARLLIAVDDNVIARSTVAPGRTVRIDAVASLSADRSHLLTLIGDRADWQLTYASIGNVHRSLGGPIAFVMVPRERPHERAVPLWLPALVALLLIVRPPDRGWSPARAPSTSARIAIAAVALLLASTLLADRVTPFKILLSIQAFGVLLALLYMPVLLGPLERFAPIARARAAVAQRWRARRDVHPLRVLPHLAVVALFLWNFSHAYRPDTGFTSLIVFGEQFAARALPAVRQTPHEIWEGSGYDGQYYAQLALDPLLRGDDIVEAIDEPGYRGRRILFSWAAYLLGLGQPAWVLQAYALLNVISWLILAWLLLRWLPPGRLRPTLAWSACMLSHALADCTRLALPDGPSVLLLALGVLAVERNRRWLATAILAMAGLGRDTNVLGSSMLLPDSSFEWTRVRRFALQAVLVVVPLALWIAYLQWGRGMAASSLGGGNFSMPLVAFAQKWTATWAEFRIEGWYSFIKLTLLGMITVTTQAIVLLARPEWRSAWWRLGIAYVALMAVLGTSVWGGHVPAAFRVLAPLTVAFNVMLPGVRGLAFWPLLVLGNANVIQGLDQVTAPWLEV